jgi:hypothetical protein
MLRQFYRRLAANGNQARVVATIVPGRLNGSAHAHLKSNRHSADFVFNKSG